MWALHGDGSKPSGTAAKVRKSSSVGSQRHRRAASDSDVAEITTVTKDDSRTTLEIVNLKTGSDTLAGVVPENEK
jgi:hypothetical protein